MALGEIGGVGAREGKSTGGVIAGRAWRHGWTTGIPGCRRHFRCQHRCRALAAHLSSEARRGALVSRCSAKSERYPRHAVAQLRPKGTSVTRVRICSDEPGAPWVKSEGLLETPPALGRLSRDTGTLRAELLCLSGDDGMPRAKPLRWVLPTVRLEGRRVWAGGARLRVTCLSGGAVRRLPLLRGRRRRRRWRSSRRLPGIVRRRRSKAG